MFDTTCIENRNAIDNSKDGTTDLNLFNAVEDIARAAAKLTPADCKRLFDSAISQVPVWLPGLTIDGIKKELNHQDQNGKNLEPAASPEAKEKNGAVPMGKDGNTVEKLPDGTEVTKHPDGTTWAVRQGVDGAWEGRSTGPKPKDNFTVLTAANGAHITQYADGHGTSYGPDGNGGTVGRGWGKNPKENFNSTLSKDGHFKIVFGDGHGSESYYDANGKFMYKEF